MNKRNLNECLIDKNDIKEEIKLIEGSKTDYVSTSGKIYKDCGNDKLYSKSVFMNKHNGYMYSSISYENGNKQRRVHKLVAEAFIEKDDEFKNIVMHIDNDKTNNNVDNLKWGTVSENTKAAFEDGLEKMIPDGKIHNLNLYK